jgi:hypothetical protein
MVVAIEVGSIYFPMNNKDQIDTKSVSVKELVEQERNVFVECPVCFWALPAHNNHGNITLTEGKLND